MYGDCVAVKRGFVLLISDMSSSRTHSSNSNGTHLIVLRVTITVSVLY